MTVAIKSLYDGQLPSTKTTLYTVAATTTQTIIHNISLVNTSDGTAKCNLYFKASGGTSRRIIPKDMELGAQEQYIHDKRITLEEAEIIEGSATLASSVDIVISGVENDSA